MQQIFKYFQKTPSNRNAWLGPIFLWTLLMGAQAAPPFKTWSDFTVRNENGKTVSIASLRSNQDVLVFIFVASTCPVTSLYFERIKGLWYNYRDRGVSLCLVGGNSDDSIAPLRALLNEQNLDVTLVWDEGHALAKAFGIEFTPEAVVLGKDGRILYRGRIDDAWRDESRVRRRYLDDALTDALQGKKTPDWNNEPFIGSRLR